jgi:hypothetical protein
LLDHRGKKTDDMHRIPNWSDANVEESEKSSDYDGKRKVKHMANELVDFQELFLVLAEDHH